jgi:hypothetical protein
MATVSQITTKRTTPAPHRDGGDGGDGELRAETQDREFAIMRAEVGVVIAARELAIPVMRDAIARLRQINAERAKLRGLLRLIGDGDGYRLRLTENSSLEETKLQERLSKVFAELSVEAESLDIITEASDSYPTWKLWEQALARLREDPDAPLPSGAA